MAVSQEVVDSMVDDLLLENNDENQKEQKQSDNTNNNAIENNTPVNGVNVEQKDNTSGIKVDIKPTKNTEQKNTRTDINQNNTNNNEQNKNQNNSSNDLLNDLEESKNKKEQKKQQEKTTDEEDVPTKLNLQTREQKSNGNILDTLKAKGLLTDDQIRVARTQANKSGDSLMDILVKMGFVTESVVYGVFSGTKEAGTKVNLTTFVPDMTLLQKIPTKYAIEHKVIPLSSDGRTVKIATNSPYNVVLLDQLSQFFSGLEINAVPYSDNELAAAVDKFYNNNIVTDLSDIIADMEMDVNNVNEKDANKEGSPVVRFINALMYEAIRTGASDIHVEPEELFVRVRFRIDGVLMNKTTIHKNYWSGICVRLKVLSGMNIAESRKPQDGAITMTIQGRDIDFRVSSIPTIYGENIVIRVLDKTQGLTSLEELGFSNHNLHLLKLALQKPEGIIVVTGPTGSGKTTTLYSVLTMINDIEDNIMTLEEPVEYRLPIIRQSEINTRAGFDFASGLRSLLRQDPDIIFLGEIRDQETAQTAIRASITGHQVLSTLHTNCAIAAINRLIDMGIQSYMLSGSLNAVIAQRLVRKLCPECKKEVIMDKKMQKAFGLPLDREFKIYEPVGCEKCNHTGYHGRNVASEILYVDEEMNIVISSNPTVRDVTEAAKKQGFKTMQHDAILKILDGITSWEEVNRSIDMTAYTKKMEEDVG